jgi:phosphoribosylformylglycinamidine synthase
VPANKWQEFSDLMKSRGVEASIIGKFTNSGKCQVDYNGQSIMDIELEFLHNGLPVRQLQTKKPSAEWSTVNGQGSTEMKNDNSVHRSPFTVHLLKLLCSLNHSSNEFISQQYDHEVQGISVIKPLQGRGRVNGDVAVLRPVLKSQKGVVLSYGLCPEYTDINAYDMAANAIDMAIRSAIATGADMDKIAILDNFCWCSSNEPERLYQLKESARACYDYAVAYGTPFISGKDSMFNDFKGYDAQGNAIKISALPTLLISAISVIDDHRKVVSIDLKVPGDLLYVLGNENAIQSPKVDAIKNLKLYRNLQNAINKGLVASSLSIGKGGLAIALTRQAMAAKLGVEIKYASDKLFSESSGRILVSINPTKKAGFEACFSEDQFVCIGSVQEDNIIIRELNNNIILDLPVDEALEAYRSRFANYLYQAKDANLAGVN